MSASDYGHYVLLESLTLVASILMLAGLPSVSLRLIRTDVAMGKESAVQDTVRISLVILACTSALTMLGLSVLAFFTRNNLMGGMFWEYLVWILAWTVCVSFLRLISELARGCQMLGFSYLVGGQNGGFGINGLLMCAAIGAGTISGLSFRAALWIQIVIQSVSMVIALILILAATRALHSVKPTGDRRPQLTQFLRSSVPLLIQQLVAFGLPEVDTMLLGSHSSGEEVAIYSTAKRLVFLASVPLLLVNHAVQPFIVDLHSRGNSRQLTTLVRGTATLAGIPSLLILLTLCLFPEFIISSIFGSTYATAATPLRILCAGAAGFVLTGSCGLVLVMTGHERKAMWSSVINAIGYLVLAPIFIQKYGVFGAATATAALQICGNIMSMLLVFYCERIWTGITLSRTITEDCIKLAFSRR